LFADKIPGFDHLDFKLSAGGDAIVLYDYYGAQVDRLSFVNQLDGVSQGRLPDASASIVSFPGTPSPGASNYVSTYAGPRLNELMALNAAAVYGPRWKQSDWLELFNPNPANFSLSGMTWAPTRPSRGNGRSPLVSALPPMGTWSSGAIHPGGQYQWHHESQYRLLPSKLTATPFICSAPMARWRIPFPLAFRCRFVHRQKWRGNLGPANQSDARSHNAANATLGSTRQSSH